MMRLQHTNTFVAEIRWQKTRLDAPRQMALVDADTLVETLFGFGNVVDVEVESSVVKPVVWLVLLARNALLKETQQNTTSQHLHKL